MLRRFLWALHPYLRRVGPMPNQGPQGSRAIQKWLAFVRYGRRRRAESRSLPAVGRYAVCHRSSNRLGPRDVEPFLFTLHDFSVHFAY